MVAIFDGKSVEGFVFMLGLFVADDAFDVATSDGDKVCLLVDDIHGLYDSGCVRSKFGVDVGSIVGHIVGLRDKV